MNLVQNTANRKAQISFKGKVETITYVDGSFAYQRIKIPVFDRKHCDMQAFRSHSKYGNWANSVLFSNCLKKIREQIFNGKDWLRLDAIPDEVKIDTSGFWQ